MRSGARRAVLPVAAHGHRPAHASGCREPRCCDAGGRRRAADALVAYVIGCALSGTIGALAGIAYPFTPFSGNSFLLKAFAVALIGGLGSVEGAAIVGILLGLVETYAVTYGLPLGFTELDAGWRDGYTFVLMIIILVIKPEGLFRGTGELASSHVAPLTGRSVAVWLLVAAVPFFVLPATPPTTPWGASNEVLALGVDGGRLRRGGLEHGLLHSLDRSPHRRDARTVGDRRLRRRAEHRPLGPRFWSATLFAVVVTGLLSIPVGLVALRTSGLGFLIVTLAFSEFIVLLLVNADDLTPGVQGLSVTAGRPASTTPRRCTTCFSS